MITKKRNPELSIVIPLFNEEKVIVHLFSALNNLQRMLPKTVEVILIDDGSSDQTSKIAKELSLNYFKKVITFSRNFGHQAALLAGLQMAKGAYVVSMDGDLQHPPKLIPKMIALAKSGVDIVYTARVDTSDVSLFKRVTGLFFYYFINVFSKIKIEPNASDFRLLNRKSLDALLQIPEKRLFLRGMVQWLGFKSEKIEFVVGKRVEGQSKYTVFKMLELAVSGITSFSSSLLLLSAFFSFFLMSISLFYGIYVVYARIFLSSVVTGWTSVMLVLLIIGSSLSLILSIIGMYIAAIYEEVKRRPEYLVSELYEEAK